MYVFHPVLYVPSLYIVEFSNPIHLDALLWSISMCPDCFIREYLFWQRKFSILCFMPAYSTYVGLIVHRSTYLYIYVMHV